MQAAPTENLAAYELFLQARDASNRRGNGGASLHEQAKLLEQAVVLDPAFGVAWARLSTVHSILYGLTFSMTKIRRVRAKECLDMAQRLIPDSPEFRLSSGYYLSYVENSPRAEEEFKQAIALAPSNPEVHYAMIGLQRGQGRWRVALQTAYDLENLDPVSPQPARTIYTLALSGRRYAEAEAALGRAEARGATDVEFEKTLLAFMARGAVPSDPPPSAGSRSYRRELELMSGQPLGVIGAGSPTQEAFVLAAKGEWEAVRSLLDQPETQAYLRKNDEEQNNVPAWSNSAVIEALRGNRDEAMRRINRALQLSPESTELDSMVRANYALVLAWTGDIDGALRECATVLRRPFARDGRINVAWIRFHVHSMRHHPAFAPLRGDPRFEALLNDPKNHAPLY
jgi:tetratricopeptide (TPR) repeat protein